MASGRAVKRGQSRPPRSLVQRTRAILQQAVTEPDGLPAGYGELLEDLKSRIRSAQTKAALAANQGLILLYWDIGRRILDRQRKEGWGAKVIDRLSRDLCREFPMLRGLSGRNLKYMRAFAEAYRSRAIVQQLAAQIPWFHHCVLMERVKDPAARVWYIKQTIANGWSRNVLALQIDSGLHPPFGRVPGVGPRRGGPPAGASGCPSRGDSAGPGGSQGLSHASSSDRTGPNASVGYPPRTARLLGAPPGAGSRSNCLSGVAAYTPNVYEQTCERAYLHVYDSCFGEGKSIYSIPSPRPSYVT